MPKPHGALVNWIGKRRGDFGDLWVVFYANDQPVLRKSTLRKYEVLRLGQSDSHYFTNYWDAYRYVTKVNAERKLKNDPA